MTYHDFILSLKDDIAPRGLQRNLYALWLDA